MTNEQQIQETVRKRYKMLVDVQALSSGYPGLQQELLFAALLRAEVAANTEGFHETSSLTDQDPEAPDLIGRCHLRFTFSEPVEVDVRQIDIPLDVVRAAMREAGADEPTIKKTQMLLEGIDPDAKTEDA